MTTSTNDDLADLIRCFKNSPEPSYKVSNYFPIYAELFGHLRGTDCTFVETGVLNGGSLFMWREWLGPKARIIGVDLNPDAAKWQKSGFEIHIGDQGDPNFWRQTFEKIGSFDVLLDDGGHQSFQQMVTLTEALRAARSTCIVVIEDTITSFLNEFSGHHDHSFLEYAKSSTDVLMAKMSHFYPNDFPKINNPKIAAQFSTVDSVQFFAGLVAYKISPQPSPRPELVWNRPPLRDGAAKDFRYNGVGGARVDWPDLFTEKSLVIRGGKA